MYTQMIPIQVSLLCLCDSLSLYPHTHSLTHTLSHLALTHTPIKTRQTSGINVYDVRKMCGSDPLCYDFSLVTKYLNQDSVKAALGTTGRTWSECNRVVDLVMSYSGDWMVDFNANVAYVLEAGARVLIYAGEFDFICNWLGNHAWTEALVWPGQTAFNAAANKTWTVGGDYAGTFQAAQNLTFLKVRNAGHMVPHDQPKNSLDMLNRHIQSRPFGDEE
jgi:carboxypeptidase C (cathepsin A)